MSPKLWQGNPDSGEATEPGPGESPDLNRGAPPRTPHRHSPLCLPSRIPEWRARARRVAAAYRWTDDRLLRLGGVW
jgi:hypothetical protein